MCIYVYRYAHISIDIPVGLKRERELGDGGVFPEHLSDALFFQRLEDVREGDKLVPHAAQLAVLRGQFLQPSTLLFAFEVWGLESGVEIFGVGCEVWGVRCGVQGSHFRA